MCVCVCVCACVCVCIYYTNRSKLLRFVWNKKQTKFYSPSCFSNIH